MVFQNNYDLGIDYTFDLRNYVPRINQEGFYSLSGLIEALQTAFTAKYNKSVDCFLTLPSGGAAVLAADPDCKAAAST